MWVLVVIGLRVTNREIQPVKRRGQPIEPAIQLLFKLGGRISCLGHYRFLDQTKLGILTGH